MVENFVSKFVTYDSFIENDTNFETNGSKLKIFHIKHIKKYKT